MIHVPDTSDKLEQSIAVLMQGEELQLARHCTLLKKLKYTLVQWRIKGAPPKGTQFFRFAKKRHWTSPPRQGWRPLTGNSGSPTIVLFVTQK